jgi:hypothetical protein
LPRFGALSILSEMWPRALTRRLQRDPAMNKGRTTA